MPTADGIVYLEDTPWYIAHCNVTRDHAVVLSQLDMINGRQLIDIFDDACIASQFSLMVSMIEKYPSLLWSYGPCNCFLHRVITENRLDVLQRASTIIEQFRNHNSEEEIREHKRSAFGKWIGSLHPITYALRKCPDSQIALFLIQNLPDFSFKPWYLGRDHPIILAIRTKKYEVVEALLLHEKFDLRYYEEANFSGMILRELELDPGFVEFVARWLFISPGLREFLTPKSLLIIESDVVRNSYFAVLNTEDPNTLLSIVLSVIISETELRLLQNVQL